MNNLNGVVETRPTLAILANVLLNVSPQQLRLTTTDMEVELSEAISGEFGQTSDITIPARKILDICRTLPEGAEITLSVEDERVNVSSGRSRFSLLSLPCAGVFPSLTRGKLIPGSRFRKNSSNRYWTGRHSPWPGRMCDITLNGVLLEAQNDRLRAVATDGHRLALCDVDITIPRGRKKATDHTEKRRTGTGATGGGNGSRKWKWS